MVGCEIQGVDAGRRARCGLGRAGWSVHNLLQTGCRMLGTHKDAERGMGRSVVLTNPISLQGLDERVSRKCSKLQQPGGSEQIGDS